jgi:hypothetical protein
MDICCTGKGRWISAVLVKVHGYLLYWERCMDIFCTGKGTCISSVLGKVHGYLLYWENEERKRVQNKYGAGHSESAVVNAEH